MFLFEYPQFLIGILILFGQYLYLLFIVSGTGLKFEVEIVGYFIDIVVELILIGLILTL